MVCLLYYSFFLCFTFCKVALNLGTSLVLPWQNYLGWSLVPTGPCLALWLCMSLPHLSIQQSLENLLSAWASKSWHWHFRLENNKEGSCQIEVWRLLQKNWHLIWILTDEKGVSGWHQFIFYKVRVVRLGLHPFNPNRFWRVQLTFSFVYPSRELELATLPTPCTVYFLSSSFMLLAETIQTWVPQLYLKAKASSY